MIFRYLLLNVIIWGYANSSAVHTLSPGKNIILSISRQGLKSYNFDSPILNNWLRDYQQYYHILKQCWPARIIHPIFRNQIQQIGWTKVQIPGAPHYWFPDHRGRLIFLRTIRQKQRVTSVQGVESWSLGLEKGHTISLQSKKWGFKVPFPKRGGVWMLNEAHNGRLSG